MLIVGVMLLLAREATGQCESWLAGPFFSERTPFLEVNDVISFDVDGGGPEPARLLAATESNVWKWNGVNWTVMSEDLANVDSFTIFNGSLVASAYHEVALAHVVVRWNGNGWIVLGGTAGYFDDTIHALAVFNGELIAGGRFDHLGGLSPQRLARWNGTSWLLMPGWPDVVILSMTVFDFDGAGANPTSLIVGGHVDDPVNSTRFAAAWTGSAWTTITTGLGPWVFALAVHNGTLYACGDRIGVAGAFLGTTLARWDISDQAWSTVTTFPGYSEGARLFALDVWNGNLVVGGAFDWEAGSDNIVLRNASGTFLAVPPGWGFWVAAIGVHNLALIAADYLSQIGQWNGAAWSEVDGPAYGYAIANAGSRLIVGGHFNKTTAASGPNNVGAYNIAGWNGTTVSGVSGGTNGPVRALESYTSLSTNYLVAGGEFTQVGIQGGVIGDSPEGGAPIAANRIAMWSEPLVVGGGWEAMGDGFNNRVLAVERVPASQFTDEAIFAGGEFTASGTGSPAFGRIAQWFGSPPSWSAMGAAGFNGAVRAIKAYNSGPIARLVIAGGDFTHADGVTVNRIASWATPALPPGPAWTPMGSGFNGPVYAIERYNGATYAAGAFTASGATTVNRLARWTGTAWVPVGNGTGFNNVVRTLLVSGADLYAAGDFTSVDGIAVSRIARYNGSVWEAVPGLGTPPNARVLAMAEFRGEIHVATEDHTTSRRLLANTPWITQQTIPQPLPCGADADFQIIPQLSYNLSLRWHKDGVPLQNGPTGTGSYIQGADATQIRVLGVSDADEGAYQLALTNPCGTLTSSTLTLTTVGACPPCPFDIAPPLTGDGVIGVDDLIAVVLAWGPCADCPPVRCAPDVAPAPTGNCAIDVDDLIAIILNWGACP
jgi:hypothetical protein